MKTLIICKPDTTLRGLQSFIETMFEEKKLKVVKRKKTWLEPEQALFLSHEVGVEKSHEECADYMCVAECELWVVEGIKAVDVVLELVGHPNPKLAKAGTVRKKYGSDGIHNCVYASPDHRTALKEIKFFNL